MKNTNYPITLDCVLPSKGLIYGAGIDPNIKLRSMTTVDEMRRLSKSENQYQNMAEMIDDCILSEVGMSSYDMCVADYKYLLYMLRVVTYGEIYKINTQCPYCGFTDTEEVNISELEVTTLDEVDNSALKFTLPKSGHEVELNYQTPRMLDNITKAIKSSKQRKNKSPFDETLLFSLYHLVKTVDGKILDPIQKEDWIKALPMIDTNTIISKSDKFNIMFGLNTDIDFVCGLCDNTSPLNIRITSEFFRPAL